MLIDAQWFTETHPICQTAFSLKTKRLCHQEQTPFQTIAIYETEGFGNLMAIDGFIMLSQRDNFFYHEMMAHMPLFSHASPQSVAIIGGGDCGTLKECLKHPIHQVTQIEIDRRVTELSLDYFPELCTNNQDPRAQLLFEDGIEWMKQATSASLDIIIVDSTDPLGPAEGLFNLSFYQQCHRVLKEGGIFVQQSESPLIHKHLIRSMRNHMNVAGFDLLLTYPFPQPIYPSGFWSGTMAFKGSKPLVREDEMISQTLQYYCPSIHKAALTEIPMIKNIDQIDR